MKHSVVFFLLIFLSLTGGQSALAVQGSEELVAPELLAPISVNIPPAIEHLVRESDMATVKLRLDRTGRVVDWVPLELPHYRLAGPLEVALKAARFSPAMVDGQPVSIDITGVINIGQGGRIGVQSVTVSDFIGGRMDYMGARPNRLIISSEDDLDEPLRVINRGQARAVKSESGEILKGQVWVEFYIGPEGHPRMVRPEDSGQPALEQAARLTVEEFDFNPPLSRGIPTVVKARILVVFS